MAVEPASTTVNVLSRIVLKGMEIFTDERKRHFANLFHDVMERLQEAQNKKYPHYSDAEVVLCQDELEAFYLAYESEQAQAVERILKEARK